LPLIPQKYLSVFQGKNGAVFWNQPNQYLSFSLSLPPQSEGDSVVLHANGKRWVIHGSASGKNYFFARLCSPIKISYFQDKSDSQQLPYLYQLSQVPTPVSNNKRADFGDAGLCMVNAACWSDSLSERLAAATMRILWRNGNLQGWCSGALVNNTRQDGRPLFLTAEHCALVNQLVSDRDLRFWLFFYHYASPDCPNPAQEGDLSTQFMRGAQILARSNDEGGEFGSDFLLLELQEDFPSSYEPYFLGWDRTSLAPLQGRVYHHPQGDLKKVSWYSLPPSLSSFSGESFETHWRVQWRDTPYGFGVTEGGSSGSLLLDERGLAKGILTGGSSSCDRTTGVDFFGSLHYGWRSNGTEDINQLAPWLDPLGMSPLSLAGYTPGLDHPFQGGNSPSVSPNPLQNQELRLIGWENDRDLARIYLFTCSGQLAYTTERAPLRGGELVLSLPHLAQGLYLLRLQQGQKTYFYRIRL